MFRAIAPRKQNPRLATNVTKRAIFLATALRVTRAQAAVGVVAVAVVAVDPTLNATGVAKPDTLRDLAQMLHPADMEEAVGLRAGKAVSVDSMISSEHYLQVTLVVGLVTSLVIASKDPSAIIAMEL